MLPVPGKVSRITRLVDRINGWMSSRLPSRRSGYGLVGMDERGLRISVRTPRAGRVDRQVPCDTVDGVFAILFGHVVNDEIVLVSVLQDDSRLVVSEADDRYRMLADELPSRLVGSRRFAGWTLEAFAAGGWPVMVCGRSG